MVLVVPVVLGLAWLHVHTHRTGLGFGALSRRGTLVVTFVLVEGLIVLVAEVDSVGNDLTRAAVVDTWLASAVVLLLAGFWPLVAAVRAHPLRRAWRWAGTLERDLAVGLAVIGAILGVLVVMAAVYPPSNTDSLLYHLVRVVHWEQDRSVAHFATHYLAQIEFAPLHEYNLLHLHLLSGTDRLDGYVQLLAVVVALCGVSEAVRLLGGGRRAQVTAALLAVTVPSLLLEATSTQNNDFAAAVGIAVLVVLLAWRPGPGWAPRSFVLGLAGGFTVLTKGSLTVMVAPMALALAVVAVRRLRGAERGAVVARRATISGLIVVVVAVGTAAPFLVRNHEVFDRFTGPESDHNISEDLTWAAAAGNVVRATANDFRIGGGAGWQTAVSRGAFNVLRPLYDLTDLDPTDDRYLIGTDTEAFAAGRDYAGYQRTEEYGANPWHVLLVLVAGPTVVVLALRGRRELRVPAMLAVGLALGYLAFAALNRWSPFTVRYLVPLLVAWCAVIALALDRLPRLVGRTVVVLLVVAAWIPLMNNSARSLLHPQYPFATYLDGYLAGGAKPIAPAPHEYDDVARSLRSSDCHALGITDWIVVEYPLWVALDHHDWRGRIEHLHVDNDSAKLLPDDFHPCATVKQVGTGDRADPVRLELTFVPQRTR